MAKCAKCKKIASGAIIEGGVSYDFCQTCLDILNTFPIPTNIMHIFLTPEDRQSQEDRNIFEARKRRLAGLSVWKSVDA